MRIAIGADDGDEVSIKADFVTCRARYCYA